MRGLALALMLCGAAASAALLLPRRGDAAPPQDAWERTMVLHRYGIGLAVRGADAPPGYLRVEVRDLGPGVPGVVEDLPPTAATLAVNGGAPMPLDPGAGGALVGLLPLAQLRPWWSDHVVLTVRSDARTLCTLDLDLLLP